MLTRRATPAVAVAVAVALGVVAGGAGPAYGEPGPPARIVGGSPIGAGEFPGLVALLRKAPGKTAQERYFCAGTLVDPTHVLTKASSCADGFIASGVEVQAGSRDLGGPGATVVDAASFTVSKKHADRFPSRWLEDIAIVTLATPITTVTPARLAGPADRALSAAGTEARIAGWGYDRSFVGNPPPDWQPTVRANVASVPVVGDRECADRYLALGGKPANVRAFLASPRTEICGAGAGAAGVGPCMADGGGPMWVTAPDGATVVIGVLSRGSGCAQTLPSVWTDVGATRRWIDRYSTMPCTKRRPVASDVPIYAC